MSIWEKILYKSQSPFNGEVKVIDSFGARRLVASGFTQSQSLKPNGLTGLRYWDSMVPNDLELARDDRVLLLGLGAGTIAKIITKRFGPIAIDGVEIDQLMVELGKKYFALNEPNLNIYITDAFKFIRDARYKYNLICIDIFKGGAVPAEFENRDFFDTVKGLLKGGGVITINKIFSANEELENFENFIRQIFPKVTSFVVRGNIKLNNVIVYAGV